VGRTPRSAAGPPVRLFQLRSGNAIQTALAIDPGLLFPALARPTLTVETKTKDNVFVTIPISVQNRIRPEKVYDAFYKLSDPTAQIKSCVEQVILGHVPGVTLDEVLASQASIAAAVKKELDSDMAGFGYEIVNVLVTDIVPDEKVKSAMNDINAAQREQVAATARGEAVGRSLWSRKLKRRPRATRFRDKASPTKGRRFRSRSSSSKGWREPSRDCEGAVTQSSGHHVNGPPPEQPSNPPQTPPDSSSEPPCPDRCAPSCK
jgi:hypothetical protein